MLLSFQRPSLAAKEDQAHLETRIKRLRQRLRNAVIEDTQTENAAFTFGRTAVVRDEDTGTVHTWTIVGSTEANRGEGKLSAESPVARALLGRAPGDLIEVDTPRGQRRLESRSSSEDGPTTTVLSGRAHPPRSPSRPGPSTTVL